MKSSGISRHPRRVYSEFCALDYASITFKGSDGCVTVLTAEDPIVNASVESFHVKVNV